MKNVIKASGLEERFSSRKIYTTILEAGGNKSIAREALDAVREKFYPNIPTQEILRIILKVLKKYPGLAEKYDLKRAIMSLGPSGFPFEQFFAGVLREYGYKTKVGTKQKGKIITHEIDIIAEKENPQKSYMIECKYHNEPGKHTKLQPAMYTYARFLDLKIKLDQPWLVTNTKCSKDAIDYAKGVNLKITSWRYPKEESLLKMVSDKKIFPITILKKLDNETKEKLFKEKIVLIRDLLNYQVSELTKKTGLNEQEINKILEEVKQVLE
jgi:hypothetical protein